MAARVRDAGCQVRRAPTSGLWGCEDGSGSRAAGGQQEGGDRRVAEGAAVRVVEAYVCSCGVRVVAARMGRAGRPRCGVCLLNCCPVVVVVVVVVVVMVAVAVGRAMGQERRDKPGERQ